MHTFQTKPICTICEAAKYLNVSIADVTDLVERRVLPVFGFNRNLIRAADLHSFIFPHSINRAELPVEATFKTPTLEAVLDEMLTVKQSAGDLSGATIDDYAHAAIHIKSGLGKMLINSIRPKDLELFYAGLRNLNNGKKLSNHSMRGIHKVMRMLFRYAHLNKYISEPMPMREIKVAKGYITSKDSRFLPSKVISDLFALLQDNPRYYVLCRLLVASGLRISEALALHWSDVDRKAGCLRVRRALKKGDIKNGCTCTREIVVGLPKSSASCRDIPLPPPVFDMIENWRHFSVDTQNSLKRKKNHTEAFVFTNQYGKVMCYHTLMYNFQNYLLRRQPHGLPRITFHMLRHSYGSLLLEKGVPLAVVSERLGHDSIEVTANIYITITNKLQSQATAACIDVLNEIDANIAKNDIK